MSETTQTNDDQIFQPGDVVQLKSGGPPMTFRNYTAGDMAFCNYMTTAGMQQTLLPAAMLRHAKPDTPGAVAN